LKYNKLTEKEEYVILHKGTEAPFSGEYCDHEEDGTYLCRRCDARLYRSGDKFESHCGWPSFDDQVADSVEMRPDPDGRRTEIVCRSCGGHLGHIFEGEGFTFKNRRHCVNSLSLSFRPGDPGSSARGRFFGSGCSARATAVKFTCRETDVTAVYRRFFKPGFNMSGRTERAIFASGCFWGSEFYFGPASGVISTRVGYTGGNADNPTYAQVCQGGTGHAEAVEVVFDPDEISFADLARLFFETHDPTQVNRQGPM